MKAKRVTFLGLSIALAMILSFVESQIPALVAVPGVKVGLPNLVMVFLLYKVGWKETVIVSLIRILLVSMLFGNVQTMWFSLAGAVLSLGVMILMKKFTSFSHASISVVGGIFHNVGQILVACFITKTPQITYYLPILIISGSAAGILVGLAAGMLEKRVPKIKF